ncbi:hypothetical protein [Alienimonas californiensis]|uniref:Cytochrome c domain-containing protein n=1 Tax=Alienimonas californiensis TaxID=2527989 RepID=A0A517PAV9_9PLAN|nr:hypothetical protein [Alienimonas californiensis]QDT16491.1 hypothetical protein CA12_25950 [Alienimonas californiensis]
MSSARLSPRIAAALGACAGLCVAVSAFAQTPAGPERPRVLVLTGGEVYGGMVTEYSFGVKVRSANGSIVLPADRIEVNAANLDEAYLQMRGAVSDDDAAGHAQLARWCLSNRLPHRSREELLTALRLEPDRDDWARTLRRLEAAIAGAGGAVPAPSDATTGVVPASHEAAAAGNSAPATAAAVGLSGDSLRTFTGQVERVLLTRCGNAGCHGGTDGGTFQLTNPSRSAITTRQNLAASLAFVGDGGNLSSPLLTACVDRPDRRGRTPFLVQGGAASRALLAAWVAQVAAERPDLAARHASPNPEDPYVPQSLPDSGEAAPASRPIRPDAFDPAEFNRTFAAPPAAPAAAVLPTAAPAAAAPPPIPPSADLPE